jgi:hypothetical protein
MMAKRLRITALLLAFIPALLYGTGIVVTLNAGTGLGALLILIMLVPLILLTVLAWYRPRWGGDALAAIGLVLAIMFLLVLRGRYPGGEVALAALIMFGLPVTASILFRVSTGAAIVLPGWRRTAEQRRQG